MPTRPGGGKQGRPPSQPLPLVIVTRAADDAAPMLAAIADLGAEALAVPCLQPTPLPRRRAHEPLLAALGRMQAIAFASRYGAIALADWLTPAERATLAARPLYAVGPATARTVAAVFGPAPQQASPSDAQHLLALILGALPRGQHDVLLPAALKGRRVLYDGLAAEGHRPHFLPVYETVLPPEQPQKRSVWPRPPGFVLFGSPSAVIGFLRQAHWPLGALALSIGPATSQALAAQGIAVYRQAKTHDAAGLLHSLAACLAEAGSPP